MDLNQFIRLVEAHAKAGRISERTLFENSLNFLLDPARQIFLAKMDKMRNWEDFKRVMRDAYCGGNSQFNLRETIRNTVQGPKENFSSFYARMLNQMRFVTRPPMEEEEKVEIIKRNLRTDLGLRLAPYEINTLDMLEKAVMRIERNLAEISGNYRAVYKTNNYTNGQTQNRPRTNQICEIQDSEPFEDEYDFEYDEEYNEEEEDMDINQVNTPANKNTSFNSDQKGKPRYQNGNRNGNYNGQGQNRSRPNGNGNYNANQNPGQGFERKRYCGICRTNEHWLHECRFNAKVYLEKVAKEMLNQGPNSSSPDTSRPNLDLTQNNSTAQTKPIQTEPVNFQKDQSHRAPR